MEKLNYYEQFKAGVPAKVKSLVEQRNLLTETIKQAQKNLEGEKEVVANLEDRIARIKGLSFDSLTSDELSFQKFKTSIKKLNAELETSQEACGILKDVILQKQEQLNIVSRNIKIQLEIYILQSRPVADERIGQLLMACVNERENFLVALARIYDDCDVFFTLSNEAFCPGIWSATEIRDLRIRLKMDESPVEPEQSALQLAETQLAESLESLNTPETP